MRRAVPLPVRARVEELGLVAVEARIALIGARGLESFCRAEIGVNLVEQLAGRFDFVALRPAPGLAVRTIRVVRKADRVVPAGAPPAGRSKQEASASSAD